MLYNRSEVYLMPDTIPLSNQNASPAESAPVAPEPADVPTEADLLDLPIEADLLEEELEELVIEDFTIDGICGVY